MMESYSSVQLATRLLEVKRDYLFRIQTDEDWFLDAESFIDEQRRLVTRLLELKDEPLTMQDKLYVEDIYRKCYQYEVQINDSIKSQQSFVIKELSLIRRGNRLKNTYDITKYGSGMMLDTYK